MGRIETFSTAAAPADKSACDITRPIKVDRTLRRSGQSTPVTANILGMDLDGEGKPLRLWLDRLVHHGKPSAFIGWSVSGAVASVLVRKES